MVMVLVGIENQTITKNHGAGVGKNRLLVLSCSPTALVQFANHNTMAENSMANATPWYFIIDCGHGACDAHGQPAEAEAVGQKQIDELAFE